MLDPPRGSFVSHSSPWSRGIWDTDTSHYIEQSTPPFLRQDKYNSLWVIFLLTQKLLNFPSEQCLLVKLKPTVGSEIVASV